MDHQLLVPKEELLSKNALRVVLGGTHEYSMDLKLWLMTQLQQSLGHHMKLITYCHQILESLLDLIHQPYSLRLEKFVLRM
ncbi:hypothetical protein Tco_0472858 [Tanacetum coccineum]